MDGAPTLALMALTMPACTTIVLNSFFSYTYLAAAVTSTAWFASFMGAVFASMAIYRTFFHRLNSFPGPAWAKVSQFYHVGSIWKNLDHFRVLDKLHAQYGEYVRVGPNLLSISDPDIVDTNLRSWYTLPERQLVSGRKAIDYSAPNDRSDDA